MVTFKILYNVQARADFQHGKETVFSSFPLLFSLVLHSRSEIVLAIVTRSRFFTATDTTLKHTRINVDVENPNRIQSASLPECHPLHFATTAIFSYLDWD